MDPTGAVIVGVAVTVTQNDTGMQRQTVTAKDGTYVFANLPSGKYDVKIQAAKFTF